MLNLEDVLKMWAKDSEIDDIRLDEASKKTASLHAKYLELLSTVKLQMKRSEFSQKTLLKQKWLYYNGKMDQDQIDEMGWDPDPFNGLKILKGEMDYYYDSDPEIQKSEEKIQYYKAIIDSLTEIMNNINWRHQTIKNMIEWKKFQSGN